MDFLRYLEVNGWIDRDEYKRIRQAELRGLLMARAKGKKLPEITDLASIRPYPIGDILQREEFADVLFEILTRADMGCFEELLHSWYAWHLAHQEPLSDYSLESDFTHRLYERQFEKRAMGQLVASHTDSRHIINDGDCVIVPPGTTAFYAALSIAALRKDISISTLNLAVIREYTENSVLRKRLNSLHVIGGAVNQTFLGNETPPLTEVITEDPAVTVAICSVEQFSPKHGPCAQNARAAASWAGAIDSAFAQGVRGIVFMFDYTKLCKTPTTVPILTPWPRKFAQYDGKVDIICCPPPVICHAWPKYQEALLARNRVHNPIPKCGGLWRSYEEVANALFEITEQYDNMEFHEPFDLKEIPVERFTP